MLRSRPFIAEATRRSKGIHSSRLRLYPDAFLDTPLPIPPISEQEEILSLVSERTQKEDQLLELNSKAITLLEEKRAALITAAVKGELNIGDDSVMPALANDNIPLLVASEIIRANQRTSRFGRVKFQKLLYLAETHIGFTEINGSYDREAAGPLDRALLNRLEIGLEAQNLFRATNPDGRAIIYEALGASPAGRDELRQAIGSRSDALFTMIQKLSDMKTKSVEAIATLFAVWNDALIDAQSPDDDFIINGVLNDWHPEKRKKFRAEDLRNWLGWMRRNGFVPKGQGPRTSTGRLFV
jgi:type I restriction enzyme S subunit